MRTVVLNTSSYGSLTPSAGSTATGSDPCVYASGADATLTVPGTASRDSNTSVAPPSVSPASSFSSDWSHTRRPSADTPCHSGSQRGEGARVHGSSAGDTSD